MSNSEAYWFHCGRCGSLFQAEVDHSDERVCARCGEHPAPDLERVQPVTQQAPVSNHPVTVPMEAAAPVRVHHHRTHKKWFTGLKIIAAWLVLVALIVVGARWLWGDDPTSQSPAEIVTMDELEARVDKESLFLEEVLPGCLDALVGYLKASPGEAQLAYLIPGDLSSEMVETYQKDAILADIDPDTIRLVGSAKLDLSDQVAVMTQWETEEGDLFDAVFYQDGDDWKLDWKHFVRYCSIPWAMFVAGTGEEVGEFRLLARERYPEKRDVSNDMGMVLYGARHGQMDEAGFKATVEPVSLKELSGKLLAAGFDEARAKVPFFGSRIDRVNPDEMIRVRLKLRRLDGTGRARYEVVEVISCHWLSTNERSVKLEGE